MPRADLASPDRRRPWWKFWRRRRPPPPFQEPLRYGGKRKRDKDLDDGGDPVEPDKPLGLSGGAAAALEFDD